MEVPRPYLMLHVFGSKGCGKTSFKRQWFESSHSQTLAEIADVNIRIQKEATYGVMETIRNCTGLDGNTNQAFVILYRPDNQESILFGQNVLDKIYTTIDYSTQIDITFVENHFEKEFKPHVEEPIEFPLNHSQRDILSSRNPPQLWRAVVSNSVQMSAVFDSIIIQPLLSTLDNSAKDKLMRLASWEGQLQVLKLLAGACSEFNPILLMGHTLTSLQQALTTEPLPVKRVEGLIAVAYYLYYVDTTMAMSLVVRSAAECPEAVLRLLKEFCQQSPRDDHLLLTGVALVTLPAQWVANTSLTHIKLSNNLLTEVPEELFQISALQGLDLSHNCLEALPSVLKWNCPKLREINVSHNRLVSKSYFILEGRKTKDQQLDKNLPDIGKQRITLSAMQSLFKLTGYNLYPCVCSIARVNIAHNPALSQIPEWVCVLPALTLLEMKGLPRLTRLTPHLAHCRSLCLIHLDTDHLVSPSPSLAQKGTRHIMAYLRCQLRGSTPYRHIKLVIVGEKGAGKTTLFRQFVRGNGKTAISSNNMGVAAFDFPAKLKVRKDRPRVTFHVIDFAGDDIYRCTHNCFLTYRSIYLCLWNLIDGKESLQRLCPWLHSIQACVPGSPVLLLATHADRRPGLSASTIMQWEEEVLGAAVQLKNRAIARGLGFPPIMQSVVMDCLNRDDVDLLLNDLYKLALQMRHPQTNVLLMNDMLPRSYQELQTLVEVKVRSLCLERQLAPVVRHEELVDYVRSLTISNPNGVEQDEEEFSLACQFLHEAGAIVHYRSEVPGSSNLYFLDPQWLFDALGKVVETCSAGHKDTAVVSYGEWPHFFQGAGLPASIYTSFLAMMEHFNIIVSLDFERKSFLMPSLLPATPPSEYPTYDLSSDLDDVIVQYIELAYLPPPLFPQLIARVILYIRQLSAQLLSISATNKGGVEEDKKEAKVRVEDEAVSAGSDFLSVTSSPSFVRRSLSFHVDNHGYLSQDDLDMEGHDSTHRLQKIWGLSTANTSNHLSPFSRHKELTRKLVTISQPIIRQTSSSSSSLNSENDQFAHYLIWKHGLYCEFPMCGTRFWLEACNSAIAIVVRGELVRRVKVQSFLLSSIGALIDECYGGINPTYYSPCPVCLQQFWANSNKPEVAEDTFARSPFEQSCQHVQINEFTDTIVFLRREKLSPERSLSFSETKFVLSSSPHDHTPSDHTPTDNASPSHSRDLSPTSPLNGSVQSPYEPASKTVKMLDRTLTLFPLSAIIHQSLTDIAILCPTCGVSSALEAISPHVLLVDFKDNLLLNPSHLDFTEEPSSRLGKGGFGNVYRGMYKDKAVAVKVFSKGYHENVLLRRYKDLRDELTIMTHLEHPHVMSLVGVNLKPLALVLELAPYGSLRNHIDLCPHGMQSGVVHQILYQIADGLKYLHSLYIVHRDIKPSNVLVWCLHPSQGVDVRLADYGVSQFYSPSGLHRQKGTEEYMAPELFQDDHSKFAYDEKVDIFSFGLVLHVLVTGRKLFPNIISKREQLRLLYHADFPQLSAALADALSDSQPLPSAAKCKFPGLLDDQHRHPAARKDIKSSCHSVCMQPLLENCLAGNPQDRPSAQGLCSRLLLCPGTSAQRDFYMSALMSSVSYSTSQHLLVGLQRDALNSVTLLPPDSWDMKHCPTPYSGEQFCCLQVLKDEVFLVSQESHLLYSLQLPALQSGHISSTPLPAQPVAIFASSDNQHNANMLVVAMATAKIAVFYSQPNGRHILEGEPVVKQVLTLPVAETDGIPTCCGLFHAGTLWCGCGRYLVGLGPEDLLRKYYKPVIKEDVCVTTIAASGDHVWLGFKEKSYLAVCNTKLPGPCETLDCHHILGKSTLSVAKAQVTAMVSRNKAVWVGTLGGHLLAFDPFTADVLLVHQKSSSILSLVCLSERRLVSFGEGVVGEESEGDTAGIITIWESYIT